MAGENSHSGDVRGLICPHIDYGRGGPVYAEAWKRAADAVQEADLVVMLGPTTLGMGVW